MKPNRLKHGAIMVSVLGATVALNAGCSSSGSGGSQASSPAEIADSVSAVQAASKARTFDPPGATFDASENAKNKTLWIIDVSSSIPLTQVTDAAAKKALGLVGAKVKRFDGKGSASDFARGVNQAIAARADGIALFAINPDVVAGPVQKAKEAGIQVIVLQYGDPGVALPSGVAAQVTYDYSRAGKLMADSIISQADGKGVGVELVTAADVSNSKALIKGFTDRLKVGCPSCDIKTDDVPVANWQTDVGTTVRSALTSDPNIKFVVPIYDGMAVFAVPAIQSSGRSDVAVVTFNGTLGLMQKLEEKQIVTTEVGSPQAQEGWALADQFLRLVNDKSPVEDENVELRLFNSKNIGSIDLSKSEKQWYGVDFQNGYEKLWGLV